jgi:hypothetical protein
MSSSPNFHLVGDQTGLYPLCSGRFGPCQYFPDQETGTPHRAAFGNRSELLGTEAWTTIRFKLNPF